ncbi:hypothetical protein Acr_17g0008200 [Actinidia rufa]|uniref:Uncharacterized protein n=1 Tax=Actinidia rufa TaxID=165716 RepID=A0A7J0G3A3_9ERIC|nr:hypothetical protein Acr_17g0008200 [Actinidia rufa]
MMTKVTQYPYSPREDSSGNDGSPSIDTRPPLERETNIMTQGELDHLQESCSFPARIQIKLPEADETIIYVEECRHEEGASPRERPWPRKALSLGRNVLEMKCLTSLPQRRNVVKDLEGRVAELEAEKQHTTEELKRMKEDHDVALERLEKEMAKLRENEALAKMSAVEEYKSSDDFRIYLQIDLELVEEDVEDEKDELDNSPPP